jgi:ABC-type sulfate/molybdate transport systems ATPase subunit
LNREYGLTVVLVSHDEVAVREKTNRMLRLEDGQVVQVGTE